MKTNCDTKNIQGRIFDIQKFSIHDGPGIRTTVFMKGCPLRCLWCHNPESQQIHTEISFMPSKCIGCGYCFKSCPKDCHQMQDNKHLLIREKCLRCGKCVEECYSGALEIIGREASVDEVISEVMKDKAFYETSGGGMTLSGGEPLFQPEFTAALLAEAKKNLLHTCIETCGFASIETVKRIISNVDIFLFDIKETDPLKHLEYTGVPIEPIRKTLDFLNEQKAQIRLRCPMIPGLNARDDHFEAIAGLANSLEYVEQIELEPYHPLGISKSERLGSEYPLKDMKSFPEKNIIDSWAEKIKSFTDKNVIVN